MSLLSCSSIIYRHLMFSTSYFKGSLSTILIKSVNAMPLWDFLQSHFEVVFKIMTIAELLIVENNIARLIKLDQ